MQSAFESGLFLDDGSELAKLLDRRSSEVDPRAAALAEEYLVMPQTWQHTKAEGRHARNIGEKFDLAPRLGAVGDGLYYQLLQSEAGVMNVDNVGRSRLARLIGHWDPAGVTTTIVNFPGVAHTHIYEDSIWVMKLWAEIAKQTRCNFLCVDIAGRGLPGFDRSERISRIGLAESVADTNTVTDDFLARIAAESNLKLADMHVVSRGHSLGALFARRYADHVIHQPQGPTLVGMIQEAPIAAGRFEDLRSDGFFGTLLPLTFDLLKGMVRNRAGLDITMLQQQGLFYGDHGSAENLLLAAYGQQRAEIGSILGAVLGRGDLKGYQAVADYLYKSDRDLLPTIGNHIIYPVDDGIFFRQTGDRMLHVAHGIEVHNLVGVPHCHFPAIPSSHVVRTNKETYGGIMGIEEKSLAE